MAKTVICFSGASDGAEMREVARGGRREPRPAVVDEEIILQAAAGADVDPAVVADVERRRSFIDRVLAGMAASADTGSLALAVTGSYGTAGPESERLRELIRQAIDETAARGDIVIVAHAASHALAASPDVLRVLVTASPETRRDRVAAERRPDEKEAPAGRRRGRRRARRLPEEVLRREARAADPLRPRREHRPAHCRAGRGARRSRRRGLGGDSTRAPPPSRASTHTRLPWQAGGTS